MSDIEDDLFQDANDALDEVIEEEDFDEEDDADEEESVVIQEGVKIIKDYRTVYEEMLSQNKTSLPYITKYEKTAIISMRMEQLARNSPPLVDVGNLKTVQEIAEKEWAERKIPFIIERAMPNGVVEYWRLSEFKGEY